jgi:ribose transport system ATP-binding protein
LSRVGLATLDLATPVEDLSPAERTCVAIARALATDGAELPTVLVLDEPTATLPAPDIDGLLKILEAVARTGVAILYVTHHLDEVFKVASSVSILRDGEVVASGPTLAFTREQIVHHLVGSELEAVHRPDWATGAESSGLCTPPVLSVDGLRSEWIEEMSFSVSAGEIVGFYGVTGSGRDAVLGTVFGARRRSGGSVRLAGNELPANRPDAAIQMRMGFVPANRKTHGGMLDLSAMENITLPALKPFRRRGRLDVGAQERETNAWFNRLDVRPADGVRLPLASFSGGNQQKIILAKWLRLDPAVLLLDEPTQGVDVGAKAVIHRTILDAVAAGLAVVIASSDDEEMAALCSRVHIVQRGHIVDTIVGDDISEAELSRRSTHSTAIRH